MSKLSKFLIVLGLLFCAGTILAEENATQTATTEENLNVQAQDLGVATSTLLPDSPFYFLKNWGREIKSLFTFDPVKKAELREKFSNEKLIELRQMVEQNKNKEQIEKGIANYQKEVEKVKNIADKIKENAQDNEEVGKFLDKYVQKQSLQEKLLEKLETQVPAEVYEKIKAAREKHLEKFQAVMEKLEDKNQERIQNRLEKNMEATTTEKIQVQIRDRILNRINATGTACAMIWDPVCGLNGKTYSNKCALENSGTSLGYPGICTGEKDKIISDIKNLEKIMQKIASSTASTTLNHPVPNKRLQSSTATPTNQ